MSEFIIGTDTGGNRVLINIDRITAMQPADDSVHLGAAHFITLEHNSFREIWDYIRAKFTEVRPPVRTKNV